MVNATLTSEDRAFCKHDGVDRTALVRALVAYVKRGRITEGGSTITAQLVKRLDHHGKAHARTLLGKLVELARAQNLETKLDKRAILEAYLNRIDYGHGYGGPEAAANGYFGVSASDVSLAEAALLAVLPRAPSALDPYRHLDRAKARQRQLLFALHARGDVTDDDLARALAEPIVLRAPERSHVVAPHVVYATSPGALDVRTTLDFDLQKDAEAIVSAHAVRLRDRGAKNTAVLVTDNATGDVLASVGSADYFDADSAGAVDLARSRRQAGSTLKPFFYAHAFETGLSPMAPLPDVPTDLGTTGSVYSPDNFDGTFAGPVSAREALAGSLNVPAVRLVTSMGAGVAVDVLRRAGFDLQAGRERYGASIALGSADVSARELAEGYMMLARFGDRISLRERSDEPAASEGVRVLDRAAAALVTDALSDSLARVRGIHARGPFESSFPVALKTGTSTAYRDAWTAGFTHERTVVVWVGNAKGTPTEKSTSNYNTQTGPRVILLRPRTGAAFAGDDSPSDAIEVIAATEGIAHDARIDVLIDGALRTSLTSPYRTLIGITSGEHVIEVRPHDPEIIAHLAKATVVVR
jgi:penicillin-binding protein 1C